MVSKQPFVADGRASLSNLFEQYNKLLKEGWERQTICTQGNDFPIYAYLAPQTRGTESKPSFWILSGIHGEEPAGPIALGRSVKDIVQLAESGIPVVFVPMLNPIAYNADDRYFDANRGAGSSVTDAEYLLRTTGTSNMYAQKIIPYIVSLTKTYPPLLVMDHHEDEMEINGNKIDSGCSYGYCYGAVEVLEPLCQKITSQLIREGFPIQEEGETRFGEKIHNGFVTNSKDGSVDELLAHLGAKAVFVVETTRDDAKPIALENRVSAQQVIISSYYSLWNSVVESFTALRH